jgi:hypothetical protein
MLKQRPIPQQYRSSIGATAFYATSAAVASLGLAILITSATIASALSQSLR